jgi:hypothetical protein
MNNINNYDHEIDEKTVYFMYGLFWGIMLSYYMNHVSVGNKLNI